MRQSLVRHPAVITAIIVLAAGALRFYRLDAQSLWNDEMFSIDAAALGFLEIPGRLAEWYHHPPFFFEVTHAVFLLLGHGIWQLRVFPALCGALTPGLVYLAGRDLWGHRAGLIGSLFCLISSFHLAYSQEGRPYATGALLCIASCYLLIRWLNQPSRSITVFYVISTILLLCTHYWGIFVFAAQVITVVILRWTGRTGIRFPIAGWLITGLAAIPILLLLRHQDIRTPAGTWFWVEEPETRVLYHFLTAYSGTFFRMATSVFVLPGWLQITGVASMLVLLVAGLAGLRRAPQTTGMIIPLALLIPAIPFAVSFVKPEAFVWYRYPVIAFPVWCLMLGGIAGGTPRESSSPFIRTASTAAAGALMLAMLWGTFFYLGGWQKSNVRDVAEFAARETREQHVSTVIRPANFSRLFNVYYHESAVQYDEAYLDTPLGAVLDTAESFIYISLDVPNAIRDYCDGHFDRITSRQFPGESHLGMIVNVYRRPASDD